MNAASLHAWWAQRPARERWLLAACAAGLFLALADGLLTAPLEKRVRRAEARAAELGLQAQQHGTRSAQAAAQAKAQASQQADAEAELRGRLQAAQRRLASVQAQAAESARLPETLRAVAATVSGVRLLELDLAAAALPLNAGPSAGASPGASPGANHDTPDGVADAAVHNTGTGTGQGASPGGGGVTVVAAAPLPAAAGMPLPVAAGMPRLYRLPITLKVSGSWTELQSLLTQIERHAQALRWTALQLDSSDWPQVQLTLNAHVLSVQPRWGTP